MISSLIVALCISLYSSLTFATVNSQFNALKNHPSPYLDMHAQDPVKWLDWSKTVLQQAQKQNKPILISSGYFACHWCHVMQQENYLDSAAAEKMNQGFISVKLDRELHPDLDRYMIEFARQLTGRAGWPQHVVLTPEGYPFAAFGYLPNQNYLATLTNIQQSWQKQSANIKALAEQATQSAQTKSLTPIRPADFQQRLLTTLEQRIDDLSGGLKGTSKFPESPLILALLQLKSSTNPHSALPETINDWLELTLEQMQNQHLKDHVNGGFYRYTVDPEWQIPHFEKMGYDNAQLANIYFQAGKAFKRADFTETAKQTLRYMEEHLFDNDIGLFASSQSALDKNGVEGADYLFNKIELQKRLSKTAFNTVAKAWQLDRVPPYDLGWHPLPTEQFWPEIKAALKTPVATIPRDSKHILSWNGLALSAYVSAYKTTQEPAYLQKSTALAEKLTVLIRQENAPRAIDPKQAPIGLATLEDYAYIIKGLQDLNSTNHTPVISKHLKTLNKTVQTLFLNENGWQTNQAFLLPGQSHQTTLMDDDLPSATALLECATPDQGIARNKLFAQALQDTPLAFPSYLQVLQCQNTVP